MERLLSLELIGFKSFAKKTRLAFDAPVTAIVGPNGSGKSNVAEAFRWVLGEQSLKSLRGRRGEDFIFGGSQSTQRLNRAEVVVTFTNVDRIFPLDFDEIKIGREVYRDGSSGYFLNGSAVRLRDVVELLNAVSLGAAGYHIINQGEVDRVLLARPAERRVMIEESLGLKTYQWKLAESEKKLTKTEANLKEVELLRREIAPHLKFLKKEVEKIEQAREVRVTLKTLAKQYFAVEQGYLTEERQKGERERSNLKTELAKLGDRHGELEKTLDPNIVDDGAVVAELDKLMVARPEIAARQEETLRRLGRIEGKIESLPIVAEHTTVALAEIRAWAGEMEEEITAAESLETLAGVKAILNKIRALVGRLVGGGSSEAKREREQLLTGLETEKQIVKQEVEKLVRELKANEDESKALRVRGEQGEKQQRGAERELFDLRLKEGELTGRLNSLTAEIGRLEIEEGSYRRDLTEVASLTDQEILAVLPTATSASAVDRAQQAQKRKELERLKIRLEEMGVESGDVLNEFGQVQARDEFLAREVADLTASEGSLKEVMIELKRQFDRAFREGLIKINQQFAEFFAAMFGGGTASLRLVELGLTESDVNGESEAREEIESGLEIDINLPRKKIRGLDMLSGGERALVSIALLFAVSQVNPPPFLILDETDAALDEANSKRYGDMIEKLSEHSQLILITHNRETMSRAGIIYGITMGAGGDSQLLSIKFDQAVGYAK